MDDRTGKAIIVTGSSRGIGFGIGIELLASGYNVTFCGRSPEAVFYASLLEHGVERERALYVQCELPNEQAARNLVEATLARFDRISGLVNNVGTLDGVEDWSRDKPADIEHVLAVNYLSAVICTRLVAPHMKANRWGRIVNITSIYGMASAGPVAAYGSSKAALASFTRSIASGLARDGINVNAVAPGNIDTEMTRNAGKEYIKEVIARTPAARLGRIDEVARTVRFLIESDFIIGHELVIDGGLMLNGG